MIRGSGPNSPYQPVNRTYASAQTDSAPQVTTTATPVAAQSNFMQTAGGIWETVKNAFTSFWDSTVKFVSKLFGKAEAITPETQQTATAYNLLPTNENVQAFLAEVRAYDASGTLGPGTKNTEAVKEVQGALKQLGYSLDVSGNYDEKTCGAIIKFKRDNGVHQNYRFSDGTWAVNEYLDQQTLAVLQQRLTNSPTTPITPTTDPGGTDYQAIAKQYNLFPTRENVNCFLAEAQGYEKNGALGPGINAPDDVKELQQVLKNFGFNLTVSGTYDNATGQAIIDFKKAYGIHQNYKNTDGTWAVNDYADQQTLKKIMERVDQTAPTTPTGNGSVDNSAIATQYNLLNNADNVAAFLAEVAQYENNGALGPGSNATADIKELQGILKGWGYSIDVNGSYDQKTGQAITAFKQANGIHQTYKLSDGQYAVNEYADQATLKKIMEKIG